MNTRNKNKAFAAFSRNARRRASDRRGILLLVVLSLLTLFLMIGTAFIVTANQYRQMNKARGKVAEQTSAPVRQVKLLDEVVNQLLRDTHNQNSVLRFHSLLRDLYGNDGFVAYLADPGGCTWDENAVSAAASKTNGQFLELYLNDGTIDAAKMPTDYFGVPMNSINDLNPNYNAYNGMVLTFLDGPARGQSTRIVGYNGSSHQFRVMTFPLADGSTLSTPADLNGTKIVINGRPFNGTGVGYSIAPPPPGTKNGAKLVASETLNHALAPVYRPIALMPNAAFLDHRNINPYDYLNAAFLSLSGSTQQDFWNSLTQAQQQTIERLHYAGLGGSDESYDAPDFQNMALAMLPLRPSETVLPGDPSTWATATPTSLGNMILPSFHRPALINYWLNQNALIVPNGGSTQFDPNMLRKTILRPSWMDHPDFTGSNPEFARELNSFLAEQGNTDKQTALLARTIYGPWDVDNDYDGVRDSIWVDFGAPVMPGPDGRLVKPLAALLVLDMDGRLNLNAHGTLEHVKTPPGFTAPTNDDLPNDKQLAGGTMSSQLPRGQGYGPAEISLLPIFQPFSQPLSKYQQLLEGVSKNDTRYGGAGGPVYLRNYPGRLGHKNVDTRPGVVGQFDLAAQMKMQGLWSPFKGADAILGTSDDQFVPSNFASPPDLLGRYTQGLNNLGQPVHEAIGDTLEWDLDSPYETDLSIRAARGESITAADDLYSLAEFERILRAYDPDASKLPPRLWELANAFKPNALSPTDVQLLNGWRTLLTTDSYDMPVPNVVVPQWMMLGENGTDDAPGSATNDDFEDIMGSFDQVNNVRVPRPPVGVSFADLLEYRVRVGLDIRTPETLDPTHASYDLDKFRRLRREMAKLLSPDLADGLRIDINRALGNGRDDNGNGSDDDGDGRIDEPGEIEIGGGMVGAVDEPGEDEGAYWVVRDNAGVPISIGASDPKYAFTGLKGKVRDDFDRDGLEDKNRDGIEDRTATPKEGVIDPWERGDPYDIDQDGDVDLVDQQLIRVDVQNFRRQLLARHLYVLAMTLADPLPAAATPDEKQARARRLAQWAINIVDFRDPDNCMTPFEYDANPFDGWTVDGNPKTSRDIYGPDLKYGNLDPGGVVWGAERPELLITETMAWHDRRTEDHVDEEPNTGSTGASVEDSRDPDDDFDQLLRPRGGAFVEIYNPWPASPAAGADTHRIGANGEDLGIDLAAVATAEDPDGGTIDSPVWRLAVFRNARLDNQRGGRITVLRPEEAALLDPDAPDPNFRPNLMDRCVYFCDFDPHMTNSTQVDNLGNSTGIKRWDNDRGAYFQDFKLRRSLPLEQVAGPCVRPGRYMMVCSGDQLGRDSIFQAPIGDLDPTRNGTVQRRVEMEPSSLTNPLRFRDPNAALNMDVPIHSDGRSICDVTVLTRGSNGLSRTGEKRRFSFSEPAKGYRDKVRGSWWSETGNPTGEGWYAYGNDGTKPYPIDTPLDNERSDPALKNDLDRYDDPQGDLKRLGAVAGYRWVYLQRLANPLLPWNPEPNLEDGAVNPNHRPELAVNPYCTIDVSTVNLSVFNGREQGKRYRNQGPSGNEIIDQVAHQNDSAEGFFSSVERGNTNAATDIAMRVRDNVLSTATKTGQIANPWTPENAGFTRPGNRGSGQHFFNASPIWSLGYLNAPFDSGDRLTPLLPFPWLTWNNRPYVSGNELMLVPRSQSSQLLREFSTVRAAAIDPYAKTDVPKATNNGAQSMQGLFGHLPNVFLSTAPGASKLPDVPAGLSRVLEYIHVPSRYVGTETWLNPAAFGRDDNDLVNSVTSPNDPRYQRQPPFNKVSTYRDPGRVNLNTIADEGVYNGLMHGNTSGAVSPAPSDSRIHPGASWTDLLNSRRAYPTPSSAAPALTLTPDIPTFFENPFRSVDAANLVPLLGMLVSDSPGELSGVNCSLFRKGKTAEPLFASASTNAFNDASRNPYFRFQPLTRLANLTTTRSNVYAVWITVGFFEVEEINEKDHELILKRYGTNAGTLLDARTDPLFQKVYPEGYMLGKEAGSETGNVQRLREFVVVDRTIPVAFEPGKNHNVDKAVRLRRRIE